MNRILFQTGTGFLVFIFVTIVPFGNLSAKERTSQECKNDESCNHYFQLWETQIRKNGMSDDYFIAHFVLHNADVRIQEGRAFFQINYLINIDWASISASDDFTVSSDNRINTIDRITPIMPINKLKYTSLNDALEDAQKAAKLVKLKFDRLSYWVPGRLPRNDGYPYLLVRGTIDLERNKCLWGYLNLYTGEIHLNDTYCRIKD